MKNVTVTDLETEASFSLGHLQSRSRPLEGHFEAECRECASAFTGSLPEIEKWAAFHNCGEGEHPGREIFAALGHAAALRKNLELHEEGLVHQARRAGVSWQKIGDALGTSRSAAWKKYRGRTA